uniref:Cilia and flagella associated protein 161 n=1 Tax=Suricata suricatta TaxID=37032 RepID=A0A673TH35_SURSU
LFAPKTSHGFCSLCPQELMKDFLEKRDKGQLLIQRNRRLKENLLRPMPLSVAEDGYVHCGHRVMLVNPAPAEPEAPRSLGGDLSLCMTPDEIRAHLSDELEVPCGLSAAQTKVPVGRNTFIILSADGDATGRVLRFGQNFRLAMTGGFEDKTLYLSSDHRTLLKSSRRSRLQEVYLTDEVSYLNCWQAAFLDPQLRLEHEGAPVPVSSAWGRRRCCPKDGGLAESGPQARPPAPARHWAPLCRALQVAPGSRGSLLRRGEGTQGPWGGPIVGTLQLTLARLCSP